MSEDFPPVIGKWTKWQQIRYLLLIGAWSEALRRFLV